MSRTEPVPAPDSPGRASQLPLRGKKRPLVFRERELRPWMGGKCPQTAPICRATAPFRQAIGNRPSVEVRSPEEGAGNRLISPGEDPTLRGIHAGVGTDGQVRKNRTFQ